MLSLLWFCLRFGLCLFTICDFDCFLFNSTLGEESLLHLLLVCFGWVLLIYGDCWVAVFAICLFCCGLNLMVGCLLCCFVVGFELCLLVELWVRFVFGLLMDCGFAIASC